MGQLRDHILTEGNIRDLVRMVDEEMDGVAREQRERLETIEQRLVDVRQRLSRSWHLIEMTDIDMSDASDRIKEHRERQEQLELAAEEARAVLAERRVLLESADTIAGLASDMSEFLRTSELTETRTFVRSFVKQITVKPGQAVIQYTIPTPEDSPIGSADAAEVAFSQRGGDRGCGVHLDAARRSRAPRPPGGASAAGTEQSLGNWSPWWRQTIGRLALLSQFRLLDQSAPPFPSYSATSTSRSAADPAADPGATVEAGVCVGAAVGVAIGSVAYLTVTVSAKTPNASSFPTTM